MHRTRLLISLAALCACSPDPAPDDTAAPWAEFDPFAKPSTYTVRPGDSLSKIAKAQGVTVADLRAWNGIEGDLIEVDQVLLVWEAAPPPTRTARAKSAARSVRSVVVLPAATVVLDSAPRPAMVPPEDGPRLVRTAGVLGAMEEGAGGSAGAEPVFADSVAGLAVRRKSGTASGLEAGRRSARADAGVAEETGPIARVAPRTGGTSGLTSAPVHAPRFVVPARKRCLAGPSGSDLDDYGMASGAGLTARQIRDALDPFVRHTSACIPAGSTGGLAITTQITVGCDGRVSAVDVTDAGGAPAPVTACIAETLAYVGFPAHDLPDGLTFEYPISYRF